MPVKPLPANPDADHLKSQARRLLADAARRNPQACQRLREFHPRLAGCDDPAIAASDLRWADGLLAIAREYGFASWARLKRHVDVAQPGAFERPLVERIDDPILRRAVEALDDGDGDALAALLDAHPDLPSRRASFEGMNYFRAPTLIAFAAENPVRNDALPPDIVDLVRLLVARGARREDIQETLGLIASGRVAREAGVQDHLIALLVGSGADPAAALDPALVHGEFAAARRLLDLGAPFTLPAVAGLGDRRAAAGLVETAGPDARHLALALAAQFGHADILGLLLEAGEDPGRFNPPGAHSHSTPLHQAAWAGHEAAVETLLRHGARCDLRDTLWNGTPADWARHAGRPEMATRLDQP